MCWQNSIKKLLQAKHAFKFVKTTDLIIEGVLTYRCGVIYSLVDISAPDNVVNSKHTHTHTPMCNIQVPEACMKVNYYLAWVLWSRPRFNQGEREALRNAVTGSRTATTPQLQEDKYDGDNHLKAFPTEIGSVLSQY